MTRPPMTPSYASLTRSFIARSTLSSSATPERPKEPSTLPDRTRHRHSSNAPLSIKPADGSRPCPIANLPSELRLCLYSYLLPKDLECIDEVAYLSNIKRYSQRERKMSDFRWKWLFCVCRLLRTEATYEFYTKTHFTLPPIVLGNYEALEIWLWSISPAQRSALTQNPNLKLPLSLGSFHGSTSSEIGSTLPKLSKRFGNVDLISDPRHRRLFLSFCTLASWWLLCAGPLLEGITWSYEISLYHSYDSPPSDDQWSAYIYTLKQYFSRLLQTVALPCVQNTWVRERREGEMKKEALNMLEAFDQAMQMYRRNKELPPLGDEVWNSDVASLRRFLSKW
jgi:hypothetical protein